MKKHRDHRWAATETAQLLQRAALLQALAQGLSYPEGTVRADVHLKLRRIRPMGQRVPDRALRRSLGNVRRLWASISDDTLRATYARLFLGNGPCPMRETAYGDGRRVSGRAAELSDINGFYQAFGVRPSSAQPDLPDHLCSELEFCSWLLVKLAYAQARQCGARRLVTRRALQAFLRDHLGRWPQAFAAELRQIDSSSPYTRIAELVAQVVGAESRRLGVRPKLTTARAASDSMQNERFDCPRSAAQTELTVT